MSIHVIFVNLSRVPVLFTFFHTSYLLLPHSPHFRRSYRLTSLFVREKVLRPAKEVSMDSSIYAMDLRCVTQSRVCILCGLTWLQPRDTWIYIFVIERYLYDPCYCDPATFVSALRSSDVVCAQCSGCEMVRGDRGMF